MYKIHGIISILFLNNFNFCGKIVFIVCWKNFLLAIRGRGNAIKFILFGKNYFIW